MLEKINFPDRNTALRWAAIYAIVALSLLPIAARAQDGGPVGPAAVPVDGYGLGSHQAYIGGTDWINVWLEGVNHTDQPVKGTVYVQVDGVGAQHSQPVEIKAGARSQDIKFRWQDTSLPDSGEFKVNYQFCVDGTTCPTNDWSSRSLTDRRPGKPGAEIPVTNEVQVCKVRSLPGVDPDAEYYEKASGERVAAFNIAPNVWGDWVDFSRFAAPGKVIIAIIKMSWPDLAPVTIEEPLPGCVVNTPTPGTPTTTATATATTTTATLTATPTITETGDTPTPSTATATTTTIQRTPTATPTPGRNTYDVVISGAISLECEPGLCINFVVDTVRNGNIITDPTDGDYKKAYLSGIIPVPLGWYDPNKNAEENYLIVEAELAKKGINLKNKRCWTFQDLLDAYGGVEIYGFLSKVSYPGHGLKYKFNLWPATAVNPDTCKVDTSDTPEPPTGTPVTPTGQPTSQPTSTATPGTPVVPTETPHTGTTAGNAGNTNSRMGSDDTAAILWSLWWWVGFPICCVVAVVLLYRRRTQRLAPVTTTPVIEEENVE